MADDDDARFAEIGAELAAAAGPGAQRWLDRLVAAVPAEVRPDDFDRLVARARARIEAEVSGPLTTLVALDLDDQRDNPLALLRRLVPIGTELLAAAGAQPVARDRDAVRLHPDDPFDLTPGSFADVDAALHEPGLRWGAAKAHVHLARRRAAGQR